VYGGGVRILDTRRRGTSKIYVIGEGPDCRPKYELCFYQENSFLEIYRCEREDCVRLQTIPVALLPFILEVVSTRARVGSEFSGESLSGDPSDLVRLIRDTGVGFGTYQTGPPDSGWIMPSNPRWDANEYRRVSLNEGYHLADNEIQFRLHPGQMLTQEAITEAVVEVVLEQAQARGPNSEGSGQEAPLRTRVFDALNEGVPLGAYPSDNEGVWTYPEDAVWDAERYRHTATYFTHNLTREERQFRSENGFGHSQALITDLVVQGLLGRAR
jgi:hypothetical protein